MTDDLTSINVFDRANIVRGMAVQYQADGYRHRTAAELYRAAGLDDQVKNEETLAERAEKMAARAGELWDELVAETAEAGLRIEMRSNPVNGQVELVGVRPTTEQEEH